LVRTREIDAGGWAKARQVAVALADEWTVIQPSNALRSNAMELVDRYDLKDADAMQLAAALYWCEDSPRGEIFLTADRRLREAAVLSGFDAKAI